jgi:hypothetical protein
MKEPELEEKSKEWVIWICSNPVLASWGIVSLVATSIHVVLGTSDVTLLLFLLVLFYTKMDDIHTLRFTPACHVHHSVPCVINE